MVVVDHWVVYVATIIKLKPRRNYNIKRLRTVCQASYEILGRRIFWVFGTEIGKENVPILKLPPGLLPRRKMKYLPKCEVLH